MYRRLFLLTFLLSFSFSYNLSIAYVNEGNRYGIDITTPPYTTMNTFSSDLSQCTAFAWGRALDRLGISITFSQPFGRHARLWDDPGFINNPGIIISTLPRKNSIAVWEGDLQNTAGHVAYVEEVDGDYVYINEANVLTSATGGFYDGFTKRFHIDELPNRGSGIGLLTGFVYLSNPFEDYYYWDFGDQGTEDWNARNALNQWIVFENYWQLGSSYNSNTSKRSIVSPILTNIHTDNFNALEVTFAINNRFLQTVDAFFKIDNQWYGPVHITDHVSGPGTIGSQNTVTGTVNHSGQIEQIRLDFDSGSDIEDCRIYIDKIQFTHLEESLTIERATQFRSYRGENPLPGWASDEDLLIVPVHVTPVWTEKNGWTTVLAEKTSGPFLGYSWYLGYVGGATEWMQKEFGRGFPYTSDLTNHWLITATNGDQTDTAIIPAIGDVQPVPLVYNVKLNGAGTTPTLSWTVPPDSGAHYTLISIIDYNTRLRLFWSDAVPIAKTDYQIPEGVLSKGGSYIFRVIICRNDNSNKLVSRSECFFGPFTPLSEGGPDSVVLPTVGKDDDATDIFGAAFKFDCDVQGGESVFLDPPVAIGYDYRVGDGDTLNFLSVKLPEVGDSFFDLYVQGESGFYLVRKDLLAGELFSFGIDGVKSFRVLGIEEEAGLSPTDTTAFITEVTFTGTGRFTGTMTPLTGFPAVVDVHPSVLNRKSKLPFFTCYIELPVGMDIASIDLHNLKMEINGSTIVSQAFPFEIGDYNSNGIPDLMVKFNRYAIQNAANSSSGVEVTVSGTLSGYDSQFQGISTLRFIK